MCGKATFIIVSKYYQHFFRFFMILRSWWIWSVLFGTLALYLRFKDLIQVLSIAIIRFNMFSSSIIYLCKFSAQYFHPVVVFSVFDKMCGTHITAFFLMPSHSVKVVWTELLLTSVSWAISPQVNRLSFSRIRATISVSSSFVLEIGLP